MSPATLKTTAATTVAATTAAAPALDPIATTMIRIFVLFVLMAIVLVLMNRRYDKGQKARAEMLAETYKTMTRSLLDDTADEDLLDAVVANLNSKLDKKNPDPYYTVPLLSRERFLIYSFWLCDHELNANNFQVMQETGSFRFVETASEACKLFGAEDCAEALQNAVSNAAGEDVLADAHIAYMEARTQEDPTAKAIAFIRDNAAAFLDEETNDLPENDD